MLFHAAHLPRARRSGLSVTFVVTEQGDGIVRGVASSRYTSRGPHYPPASEICPPRCRPVGMIVTHAEKMERQIICKPVESAQLLIAGANQTGNKVSPNINTIVRMISWFVIGLVLPLNLYPLLFKLLPLPTRVRQHRLLQQKTDQFKTVKTNYDLLSCDNITFFILSM
jgi:hypothetical protein